MHTTLIDLGDALERAARADLRPHRRRRRIAAGAALAVLVPAAAVGASELLSTEEQVARSIPAGTLSLAGTEPACTVVHEGVEFHCTLSAPPAPEVDDWRGTVEPTVGPDKRVNGGCRSLRSDGMEWQCYLGQAAVEQRIISAQFLGDRVTAPGRG
jgi:hypothetical protein